MIKNKKIEIDDKIVFDQTRLNVFMMKINIDQEKRTKFKSKSHEIIVLNSKFSKTTNENEK